MDIFGFAGCIEIKLNCTNFFVILCVVCLLLTNTELILLHYIEFSVTCQNCIYLAVGTIRDVFRPMCFPPIKFNSNYLYFFVSIHSVSNSVLMTTNFHISRTRYISSGCLHSDLPHISALLFWSGGQAGCELEKIESRTVGRVWF